jgi:spore maturation protein CgeB
VRLFEAGACATPIISDRWAGIDDLFEPGSEIILADATDDVVAALGRDAAAMGDRARQTVLAHHSAERRAAQLERDLAQALQTQAPANEELYAPHV